jgi:hypothetical protein
MKFSILLLMTGMIILSVPGTGDVRFDVPPPAENKQAKPLKTMKGA